MKFPPAQCREAFYKAAANIEARPELYDFHVIDIGEGDCPACMWGHVGRALGLPAKWQIQDHFDDNGVTNQFGMDASDLYLFGDPRSDRCPGIAADKLRAFADHHWPAESTEPVRPDLQECGMSFTELLQHINGVSA